MMHSTGGRRSALACVALLLACCLALAQSQRPADGLRRTPTTNAPALAMPPDPHESALLQGPEHPVDVILGRPTGTSIVVSVLCASDTSVLVAYGTGAGRLAAHTDVVSCRRGEPQAIVLHPLLPNCHYDYQVQNGATTEPLVTGAFHTQRAPGSTFVFALQGDSHPEQPRLFDPQLYTRTLLAAAADHPDFYLTSGGDFSVELLRTPSAATVRQVYLSQRRFLSLVAHTAPLFLVNGDHEQAAACYLDGTPSNVAVWAQTARNAYFPQPAPDAFYSGDAQAVPFIGLLRDYYAWTWGDALFVVIDPYWHTPKPVEKNPAEAAKPRDPWTITLGDDQYHWFQQTLAASTARHKFVFAHHVLGTGRGGIEQASLFEWGGKNRQGKDEFARKRPGWDLPLHALMVKYGVTIFFQGHDHLFVRQQLDGVVYQTLPVPADPTDTLYNQNAYRTGAVFPNSGYLRVTVAPERVHVAYVRSRLERDATPQHPDGEIAFAYDLPP